MTTRKVLTLASMVAALFAPAVFAGDSYHVIGEKLDSGLGALPSDYTGPEGAYLALVLGAQSSDTHVLGESSTAGSARCPPTTRGRSS